MMRIRRRQMEVLAEWGRAQFIRRALEHLAALDPPRLREWTQDQTAEWVESWMDHAPQHGLDDEPTILCWLEVAAFHGDELAGDAFVYHLLAEPDAIVRWHETRALIASLASFDPEKG